MDMVLHDDVWVLAQRVGEDVAGHAVDLPMDNRPLQEVARLDLLAELLRRVEVVGISVLLAGPWLSAGGRDIEDRARYGLQDPRDDGVLAATGRCGDVDEQPLAVDRRHDGMTSANTR